MSCSDNKKKHECGKKSPSACVFYEDELPEWSSLKSERCVSIEESTKELYDKVTELNSTVEKLSKEESTDTPDSSNNPESDKENTSTHIRDISVTGLSMECFTSPCGSEIKTLEDFIKVLITKYCKTEE